MYDLGDRLLMVACDRISTYDVVHPTPIPDKGRVLTGLSVFWFGQDRPHRAQPPALGHRRRARRGPRPRDRRAQAADAARRVRRARLHHGLGLEGLPGHRHGLGHRAAAGPARVRAAARADLHARRRRPRRATTRRSTSSTAAEPRRRRATSWRACATSRSSSTAFAADHARERGVILADTKFEFGLDDDGELVVGDEVLTPDSSRYWPADGYEPGRPAAELRQAVRPRLGVRQRLGQDAAGARDARRRRRRHAASGTSRPTRRSPASRSPPGWRGPRREGARAHPAQGGDPRPAGHRRRARAARARLRAACANVHVGRLVELDVDDPSQLDEMCRSLLANPLIEDYEVVAAHEGRRRPLPGLLRRRRRAAGRRARRRRRAAVARRAGPARRRRGRRSRAASPTATTCASARSRASRRSWSRSIAFAREGGPVLGICNGFQILCEAGLLPGALLPNTALRFVCRQVDARGRQHADTPFTHALRRGRSALDPGQAHDRAATARRPSSSRSSRRPGRSSCATRRGTTRTARERHRRRVQRRGQRPRADAASRARGRRAHRLGRRPPALRVDGPARAGAGVAA